jgi:hypothetical protein
MGTVFPKFKAAMVVSGTDEDGKPDSASFFVGDREWSEVWNDEITHPYASSLQSEDAEIILKSMSQNSILSQLCRQSQENYYAIQRQAESVFKSSKSADDSPEIKKSLPRHEVLWLKVRKSSQKPSGADRGDSGGFPLPGDSGGRS